MIVSAEVGYEKPDERIFKSALGIGVLHPKTEVLFPLNYTKGFRVKDFVSSAEQISVEVNRAVHVGDDEGADKGGANAMGIACWCATYTLLLLFFGFVEILSDQNPS